MPANGYHRGWDANGGSEGGVPPSWGDRRHAAARGGMAPWREHGGFPVRLRMPTPSANVSDQ